MKVGFNKKEIDSKLGSNPYFLPKFELYKNAVKIRSLSIVRNLVIIFLSCKFERAVNSNEQSAEFEVKSRFMYIQVQKFKNKKVIKILKF